MSILICVSHFIISLTKNIAQREHEQPPLLFVDVNIGEGEKPRIVVYSHDDPKKVAYKFAK